MTDSKYSKYIVSELKNPFSSEQAAQYAKWATRILWMDNKVVDGAFQMNCSWFLRLPDRATSEGIGTHTHDTDEIIGFFGSNPEDPYDLGGKIEFWIEDEKHILTRSCMIFVPRGMRHCPLKLLQVDRPIFHFSTVTSGQYELIRDGQ
jgi:hypothetical protein